MKLPASTSSNPLRASSTASHIFGGSFGPANSPSLFASAENRIAFPEHEIDDFLEAKIAERDAKLEVALLPPRTARPATAATANALES